MPKKPSPFEKPGKREPVFKPLPDAGLEAGGTAFRTPAPITPMTEEVLASVGSPPSLHRFDTPQDKCPECKMSNQHVGWWKYNKYMPDAVYGIICSPKRRFRSGFLWLRKCLRPGTHVHEFCKKCGAEWTTGCPKD